MVGTKDYINLHSLACPALAFISFSTFLITEHNFLEADVFQAFVCKVILLNIGLKLVIECLYRLEVLLIEFLIVHSMHGQCSVHRGGTTS